MTSEELKNAEKYFTTQLLGLSLVKTNDGRIFDIEPGYDHAVEIHDGNLLEIAGNIVDWLDDPEIKSIDDLDGEAKSDWDYVRTSV